MRVIQSQSELHHRGLEDVYAQYNDNLTAFWKQLFPVSMHTNESYIRFMQDGDFGMAPIINEANPIGDDDFFVGNGKNVTPFKRGLGFSLSTEASETDQMNKLANIIPKIKLAFNITREQAAADLAFNNVKTATGIYQNPDGVALASSSHTADGANQSNLMTTAFGPTALESMVQNLTLTKSHRGNPAPKMGPYLLIIHPSQRFLAERTVFSAGQQGTANNDKNRVGQVISLIHANPFFTQTLYWGLKEISGTNQPLAVLERRGIKVRTGEDIDIDTMRYRLSEVYAFFARGWRGSYYSDGSGT